VPIHASDAAGKRVESTGILAVRKCLRERPSTGGSRLEIQSICDSKEYGESRIRLTA
jgi:hypothetical protein